MLFDANHTFLFVAPLLEYLLCVVCLGHGCCSAASRYLDIRLVDIQNPRPLTTRLGTG